MSPEWLPVLFMLAAAMVKGTMSVLDKSGALDKLPAWLRPQVTAIQAAVVGLLAALAAGVAPHEAILAALGIVGVSHHAHATMKGIKAR